MIFINKQTNKKYYLTANLIDSVILTEVESGSSLIISNDELIKDYENKTEQENVKI